MTLRYQPFDHLDEIDHLRRELAMNVADGDRVASGALGLALIGAGLASGRALRWPLVIAGGGLLYRSFTGRCPLYAQLGMDTRHRHEGPGVPGNDGTKIEEFIEINRSAQQLYDFWRQLDQLPRILRFVESVRVITPKRSRWTLRTPLGMTWEWDAEIIQDEPGKMLAWQSLPGADLKSAGSVWFEPTARGTTRVKVAMEFEMPGRGAALSVATLLGNSPTQRLREDLGRFKEVAEREFHPSPAL